MSTQEISLLEKLANTLVPGQAPRPNNSDEEEIKSIIAYLIIERLSRQPSAQTQQGSPPYQGIEELADTILSYVKGNTQLSEVYNKIIGVVNQMQGASQTRQNQNPQNQDPDPCRLSRSAQVQLNRQASSFPDAIVNLKKLYQELNKARNTSGDCRKLLRALEPFMDTCYDDRKAEKLENALEELKRKLCNCTGSGCSACSEFIGALCLLASTHLKLDKTRWFNMLARAAVGDGDRYLPTCPWEGDAAAILYYLYRSNVSECKLEVAGRTGKEAVAAIVEKLLA